MVAGDDLSGFWAGIVVQGSDATRVFLNLSVEEDNTISGSYEVPTSPSIYRTGIFSGTYYDDALTITLTGNDAHGALEFKLNVIQVGVAYMLLGYTSGAILASLTAFRFGGESRQIPGIWP